MNSQTVRDWKLAKTLKMISGGQWTIRRAAKFAGLTNHEMLDKMTEKGVDSGPLVEDLREGLDRG